MVRLDPPAFDALAATYDDDFTHSALGRRLRLRVWEMLAAHFASGQHIFELACGTGEDAVWLARRGVQVTAADASGQMVRIAKAKVQQAGQADRVAVHQLSFQQFIENKLPAPFPRFDGVFSNFGGLNTIDNWSALAEQLARILEPGAKVILVPMGVFCPWEILWYASHGHFRLAVRRWQSSASAKVGDSLIPVWYPAPRQLRADFQPWFEHLSTKGLGLWLPPSYLEHFVRRWPRFFGWLDYIERRTTWLTGGWGDHYISVFRRKVED